MLCVLCIRWQISRSEALVVAPEVVTGALFRESSRLGAANYVVGCARALLVAASVLGVCEGRDNSNASAHPA